jgi:tRNA 2-thiouridine synthesizing protein E
VTKIKFNEKTFEVSEKGFLVDPSQFCKEWVEWTKTQGEITEKITREHWLVIKTIRAYFKENGIAPMVRVLTHLTKLKLKRIYELFEDGPKGACKVAGLPNSRGCA